MDRVLFGAIDIGTNAGRLLIGYAITRDGYTRVRQVQMVRVPLRLGDDVFQTGIISKKKEKQFMYALKSFILLMKAYGVKSYTAYATSAMREAKNKKEILDSILKRTGIAMKPIDGKKEADLIMSTFYTQKLPDYPYLFIDVGGGSTELSIIMNGEKLGSKSFQMGTVRNMIGKTRKGIWRDVEKWMGEKRIIETEFAAIGTGGNINRVAKLHEKKYLEPVYLEEVSQSLENISRMSYEDRIELLRLKPDRADVIVPALEIYKKIMEIGQIEKIYVPRMGLADGMILEQYFDYVNDHNFF